MPEALVLCGATAGRPRGGEQLVRLDLAGNVQLRLDDLSRRMVADVPDALTDLIEIATYVYCADQLVSRGGEASQALGAAWRRQLRFRIPVRCPDLWASDEVSESLESLLGFMSDDQYRFEFVSADTPPAIGTYLALSDEDAFRPDSVLLFSGGLDSLSGAVESLEGGARLILVSHQSAATIAERQKHLAKELRARFPAQVMHVPVRITKRQNRAVETTQRTRSFLFASLAVTVGYLAGRPAARFFENGVVSFNLPISGQVVGARASRSTHPKVIADLSSFLSSVLVREVPVDNPFIWRTKGDVVANLGRSRCRDLIPFSVSCSHVHGATRLHSHCGRCSQCLERRFAALAAGLGEVDPAEMYAIDLLAGPRDDGMDRTMAESYVRHARELSAMTDRAFAGRFAGHIARAVGCFADLNADQVMAKAFALHRRHGEAVVAVLEGGFKAHAKGLADGRLPASCLLRMAAGEGGEAPTMLRDPVEVVEQPAATDRRDFRMTSEIRLALDSAGKRVLIEGIPAIGGTGSFALAERLARSFEADRSNGRAPEDYGYVASRQLERDLSVSQPTLRRRVMRFRRRVGRSFQERAGLTLSGDAVIQSVKWRGYRLNPAVRLLATDQVSSGSEGHDLATGRSRLERRGRGTVPA